MNGENKRGKKPLNFLTVIQITKTFENRREGGFEGGCLTVCLTKRKSDRFVS